MKSKMNLKISLKELLNMPVSPYEKYHEKTKIRKFAKSDFSQKGVPEEWKTVYFKGYGRLAEIMLPKPDPLAKELLRDALKNRKSSREFGKEKLPLTKLSTLLFYSAGLRVHTSSWTGNRFYPSGGSRYPLEVYFLSLKAQLPCGLYHYYLKNHSLESLLKEDKLDLKKYFNQDWIADASGLIIISAVFKRMTMKYKDRGYKHIMIEAGHLGQNIYLLSAALNLNCCAIGGFVDDKLNELLDVDGISESVVYVIAIGC